MFTWVSLTGRAYHCLWCVTAAVFCDPASQTFRGTIAFDDLSFTLLFRQRLNSSRRHFPLIYHKLGLRIGGHQLYKASVAWTLHSIGPLPKGPRTIEEQ